MPGANRASFVPRRARSRVRRAWHGDASRREGTALITRVVHGYVPTNISMHRGNALLRQSRMFAEFVAQRQTPLGFGDASRRGDSSSRLRNPSLYMAAAHAQATATTPPAAPGTR